MLCYQSDTLDTVDRFSLVARVVENVRISQVFFIYFFNVFENPNIVRNAQLTEPDRTSLV